MPVFVEHTALIFGNNCPKESGQSGTASAEPVLVTKPPAMTRKKVATAIKAVYARKDISAFGGIRLRNQSLERSG